ncbi:MULTISPECIES: ATP-binding protein [Methanobrevibacter]|jgi:hypothetical protein|uniref:ATP-binding protein n=1 Tax=Methanobrevibacter TaxID=2172 RepID=UPI0038FD3C7B
MTIEREIYTNQIKELIDQNCIKILAGIKRAGKTKILKNTIEELKKRQTKKENITEINFENGTYHKIKNNTQLDKILEKKITKEKQYIFFYEIQNVENWNESINKLQNTNTDIYLTISNKHKLNEKLQRLKQDYKIIKIYPLNFKEIIESKKEKKEKYNEKLIFEEYLISGGIPYVSNLNEDLKLTYLEDLYNSIIFKEVVQKNPIKSTMILDQLIRFITLNIGFPFSANSISKYFKKQGLKISHETVYNYLTYCEEAYFIHKVKREDLIEDKVLKTNEKFYLTDHGFRQALCLNNTECLSQILENIVYMEMLRRGYSITIGKLRDKEIDFICIKNDEKIYFQITDYLTCENDEKREFGELLKIENNYPKFVISADETDFSQKGIKHYNIIEFLKTKSI